YTASNATGTLTINGGTATITLSNLTQPYNGSPKSATATTSPAEIGRASSTDRVSATVPADAGSYTVVASLNNANYTAPNATGTATTSPAGLSGVSITYNGSATVPTDAGSYAVVASLNNAIYTASNATGTLTISQAPATITLSNLTQPYNGSPKSATATTSPAGLSGVSITYNGLSTAPTATGSYAVVASLTNANYAAPDAIGTLTITNETATITLSNLT